MKRNIRRSIDVALTAIGVAIIFTAVLLSASLTVEAQLPIALVGVLFMEAGVWGLSEKVFPSERRYIELRAEGENIIHLIRKLNAAALAREKTGEDDGRFQATLDEMHESVNRMAQLAYRASGPSASSG